MKIDCMKLHSFVKKASLNGAIQAINMDFKEDGVHSRMMDAGNIALTDVFLSVSAFENYEAIGEIFIRDALPFMKQLQTFIGEVDISTPEKYVFKIADATRTGYIMLGAEIVCDGVYRKELPVISTSGEATLEKSDLTRTFSDISLLKINKVLIELADDGLFMTVGQPGESDYFINKVVETVSGKGRTAVGSLFSNLFGSLDGKITFNIGDGLPLVVSEITETSRFVCVLAPMATD